MSPAARMTAAGAWAHKDRPPLITLVTATFNAAKLLPITLASVRAQSCDCFEWIVADGGSSDGTLKLIEANSDLIDQWISRPDSGVYDAWNRACAMARGEWVLFLGAGDELGWSTSLERMAERLSIAYPDHALVYGKVQYLSEVGRAPLDVVGEPWEALRGKWELMRPALPPHGAVFHHRSLLRGSEPFDTRFRIAGDSHFMLRHIFARPPLFVPELVNRTPIGGLSFTLEGALEVAREIAAINHLLGIRPPLRHVLAERLLLAAKIMLARGLPRGVAGRIADLYRWLAGRGRRWSVK
jgi:hypothetical protein